MIYELSDTVLGKPQGFVIMTPQNEFRAGLIDDGYHTTAHHEGYKRGSENHRKPFANK